MSKNRWLLLRIIICFAVILYFLLLTQGLPLLIESEFPFGLSDRFGNYQNTAEIIKKLVNFIPNGIEYYDRPIRTLSFRITYHSLGLNPFGYYLIRAVLLSAVVLLIANLLKDKKLLAIYAGLFYIFAPPVYMEAIQLEDIGLFVELLILCCFYLFLKIYNEEKPRKNRMAFYLIQGLIVFFSLIANGAKGNARIIPAVLLGFIIFNNRKKLLQYSPLILLLSLNVLPVNYLFKWASVSGTLASGLPYGLDFSKIYKLFVFNSAYNTCFGASLTGVMGVLNIWLVVAILLYIFRRRLVNSFPLVFNQVEINNQDKALICFSAVWLFLTVGTSIVYQYVEPQRLANSMVPAILLFFLLLYYLWNSFKGKYKFLFRLIIFGSVIFAEAVNLGKIFVLRDKNTTYLIAQHNLNRFIEEREKARNSLVLIFKGGTIKTQANAFTTNTYLPTLVTNPASVDLGGKSGDGYKHYENIYVVSGFTPIMGSQIKGLRYLAFVDGTSASLYDWVRNLIPIPRSFPFYIYKYTGDNLGGSVIGKSGNVVETVKISGLYFPRRYLWVDYRIGDSGIFTFDRIDKDNLRVRIISDNFWGEEVNYRGKIEEDKVRIGIGKADLLEIVFKKDNSLIGRWREGNMEQGTYFGRLDDNE